MREEEEEIEARKHPHKMPDSMRKSRHQNRSSSSLINLVLTFMILLLPFCLLSIEAQQNDQNLALRNHLIRIRRQQQQTGGSQLASGLSLGSQLLQGGSSSSSSSSSPPPSLSSAGSSSSNVPDDANSQDGNSERAAEEISSGFKCDFGTSEAPDLCKFKLIEPSATNPLNHNKALPNWAHGSGRLALYQGGPLFDASDRNDTSGGYIFYETSNPFALVNQSASPNLFGANLAMQVMMQEATASQQLRNSAKAKQANLHASGAMQSSMSTNQNEPNLMLLMDANNNGNNNNNNYQQLSSGRLSINAAADSISPAISSPNITATGPSGMCLSFQYAIKGLSAEELRIQVHDSRTERTRLIWASSESAANNWTKGEVLYSATNVHSLVFSSSSATPSLGFKDFQQRKFRGYIALDEIELSKHDPSGSGELCKGHCNFDGDLCGWQNAESGLEDDFDWSFGRSSDNLFTGPSRDFTSSASNEPTGSYLFTDSGYPRRPGDRAILVSPMFQPTAVNDAMCMRFAVHMFGSGIGSLAIKIRYADESSSTAGGAASLPVGGSAAGSSQAASSSQSGALSSPGSGQQSAAASGSAGSAANLRNESPGSGSGSGTNDMVIWEMSGDAGNSWHQAQTSVSSSRSPFQVLIEGVVGENHLGNMAIDEIAFSSGPCPTSPPVASKNYGDCTFEQSMCYWRNPDAEIHLDDLDWIRSADEQSIHGPNFDHTLKRRSGSYLKLENTFREPKSGTRAFLLSPIFEPKSQNSVQCLSFYYYMFMRSVGSSGPNLGTIRVYLASNNELVPIWRLTNPISSPSWKHARASLSAAIVDGQPTAPTKLFQIAFEGIWGDAVGGAIALDDVTVFDGACDIMPPEARSVPGECTFDVDLCNWTNKTSSSSLAPASASSSSSSLALIDSSTDSNRSPFLQSVSSNSGHPQSARLTSGSASRSRSMAASSWQLATVDSRPVNLQDHTYKAPIGYVYVDILDGSGGAASGQQQLSYILQSSEFTVQSGQQQVTQCLSFWFAAFGRQDSNSLNVHLTQASAPPPQPEEGGALPAANSGGGSRQSSGGSAQAGSSGAQQSGASAGGSSAASAGNAPAGALSSATGGGDSSNGESDSAGAESAAWKLINGRLVWSVSLKNVSEANRRKWQYAQVSLRADSNYIVRFVAQSSDGGFALDDVSYYEGACETRPAFAKVLPKDDENETDAGNQPAGRP